MAPLYNHAFQPFTFVVTCTVECFPVGCSRKSWFWIGYKGCCCAGVESRFEDPFLRSFMDAVSLYINFKGASIQVFPNDFTYCTLFKVGKAICGLSFVFRRPQKIVPGYPFWEHVMHATLTLGLQNPVSLIPYISFFL